MQFGVLQFFSWPNRRFPLPEVYQRAFDRIDVMERSGYDAVWLAEHHFSTYSVCPSIHMMGAHIAARTQRLRIGTAVSLAPFYHPLRLAEEVALLDVLSGGRVNFGAGRGFDVTEYRNFGVARENSYPMFREHVRVVLDAWRNERLTFHGQFCNFDDVEVLPKPLQRPHPPVWLASSSEDAVVWSARNGYSILMDPHSSHAEIAAKRARYQIELEGAGFSAADRVIPMARNIALATSESKAREVAISSAGFMFGSYLRGAGWAGGAMDPLHT
jgi:alkanesulfonate monooxygenase SsuD/methylene tetrahydromethanopterin reductase-like flavin-dependent oxidoreductase (luciferase family)